MNEDTPKNIFFGFFIRIVGGLFFTLLWMVFQFVSTLYVLITNWKGANLEIGMMQYRMALCDDQKANVVLGPLLNAAFVKKAVPSEINEVRVLYGHQDDTISDITGRLMIVGGLNRSGERFRKVLNKVLGKEHCIKSVSQRNVDILKMGDTSTVF